MLGYGSVGWGRYPAQQQQQGMGARTYALQPISSSVPNPSASGPMMHDSHRGGLHRLRRRQEQDIEVDGGGRCRGGGDESC